MILIALATACSDEIEEYGPKKINTGSQKQKGRSELYCLDNFSKQLSDYFDGKLNRNEVSDFWNCTARATEVFEDYAKTDDQGVYSLKHLQNFVSEYFWKELPTDKLLLAEILYLKTLLFGGSDKKLTRSELAEIRNFIKKDVKTLSLEILPHIPVLFSGVITEKISSIDERAVDEAATVFRSAINKFSGIFLRGKRNYSFHRFKNLLIAIQPFVSSDNPKSRLNNLSQFVPVIQETKVLLVGPIRDQILATEWDDFFSMLSEAFVIWLRYENYLKESDLTEGPSLNQFYRLVSDILLAINKGLQNRPDLTYTSVEARKWILELDHFFGLPFELELSLVDEYWPWFTDVLLETKSKTKGLNPEKIEKFKKHFEDWRLAQLQINTSYGPDFNADHKSLKRLNNVLLETPFSLRFDNLERIIVPNLQRGYDRTSLNYLNLITLAVDILVKTYSKNYESHRLGLTIPETTNLIGDLKNLLISLDFMEPTDEGFVGRLYRDTSVFVPQANGDEFIDSTEFSGFLHFVFSGVSNLNLMKAHTEMKCLIKKGLQERYGSKCLQDFLLLNLPSIAGNLPQMQIYHQELLNQNQNEAKQWVRNLLETISFENLNRGYLSEGEVLKLHVLLHYIETFIYRFDLDKSGDLDPKEVNEFLDKFMTPISKLMGQEGVEDFVRSFFTYVSKYQKSPLDTSDHASSLRFHVWSKTQSQWEFQADRYDLSFVLAVLGRF